MPPTTAQASTMSQGPSHFLIVGAPLDERLAVAASYEAALLAGAPTSLPTGPPGHWPPRIALPAAQLPFIRPSATAYSGLSGRSLLRIDDFDEAFPNHQVTGTR